MTGRKNMVNVGDKIEIIREKNKTIKFYPSQILDIIEENIFIISGPIYKNEIILLHKQEKIEIGYTVENRGIYVFSAIILDREYSPIYKLKIKKSSEVRKYQKRAYYRFETSIPVLKEQINKKGDEDEIIIEECRTKDISGNGLKLLSNLEHKVGDKIICQFDINNETIKIESEIVRLENIDTFDFKYALGIKFIGIEERDRDTIIKFIFEKERLLRGKGLI